MSVTLLDTYINDYVIVLYITIIAAKYNKVIFMSIIVAISQRTLYKRPPLNTIPYQLSKWRKVIAEIGFGTCYFPMCTFQSNDFDALRSHAKICSHAPAKVRNEFE